jgi:hypothetical protein
LHGVQGVASSNPAAPTIRINKKDQSADWSFLFSACGSQKCPTKCPTNLWAIALSLVVRLTRTDIGWQLFRHFLENLPAVP